ncbi:hypothetical protein OG345_26350 [Streptomyces sp. NBC_01220]|uniref:hypothetical protein n=1 Tax=Streptomyces sp. NBC_01220 TaxID=2903781 RepID=UPI00352E1205|nr:hypothetical protein OG345_26350 [Streptomyces sp. NBC_01220]
MKRAYDRWHQALFNEFFGADHALQSTVLYVDDEVERELAERNGIDTPLSQAVVDEMYWEGSDQALLWRVLSQCRLWAAQGCNGAPPSLPVLAASVLAATRMATSDGMRRTNFRGRWYQMFGVPQEGYKANRLDKALDDVAAMWEQLDSWLEETGGLYGASTVSTDEFYWRVGYPVSQALVRRSDRQALTRFFATTRLRPRNSTDVPGRELLRRLTAWSAGRDRRLSPRLMEELRFASGSGSFEKGDPLIVSLLERLARDWDGTLHEPDRTQRRRALGLRLAVTDRGRRLEWLADTAEGVEETTVRIHDGRSFTLHTDYGDVYSGLETLQPSEAQLRLGVRLEGDELVIEWVPQDVVLLRMHSDLGEWVSTEYFEPGDQHWILASSSAAGQVRSMLREIGTQTIRETSVPGVPGWRIFKGVRAVDSTAFTNTLDSGGEHIHVLQPQVRQDTKLMGGLRIAREYRGGSGVAGHYLRGGEPDLLLPAANSSDGTVEVALDGRTSKLLADPRVPFPLNALQLEEGQHKVGTSSSSQVFTVYDGFHERLPDGTGSLGYKCDRSAAPRVSDAESADAWVRGAAAPAHTALPRTVIVKREVLEAFFLDPYGGVFSVHIQQTPPWVVKRLPEAAASRVLETEAPTGAVWFVYRTPQRWWVRAVVPDAAVPAPEPSGEDFRWAYAVLSAGGKCSDAGWPAYVQAAEAVTGTRDRSAE